MTANGAGNRPQRALEMNQVEVVYDRQPVLSSFSLEVNSGEKVCLKGSSGCGKSTVLRCLLGLVIPQAGVIRIQEECLGADSVWQLRSRMAWVPQDPDWGGLSVRDALRRPFSFRTNHPLPAPEPRMAPWLDRFLLPESLLDKSTSDLSGGERQRIGLIAALLLQRPILLLDEITSALDPTNRDRVREVLHGINDQTVLAVSHDAEAETWAHRWIEMEAPHA